MAEAAEIPMPIERPAPDTIRLERILNAPPETIWRYLTEADLREQWFMGGTDARPAAEFELIVDHDKLSEDDVPYPESHECFKGSVFREKVLRFEPPQLLETTFQGGKSGIVTYELFPEGQRTRLVLTHRGITSPSGFQDFGAGWTSHLAVLEEKLAGRSVPNFWELHARCLDEVAEALG
ncbi:MAG TPA: SRPBCC family protein [Sphingomicrobium sp.]|nr:SRPBCC family protein [Sphingomicrobium sp.]